MIVFEIIQKKTFKDLKFKDKNKTKSRIAAKGQNTISKHQLQILQTKISLEQFKFIIVKREMILEWCLILALTSVSFTQLMVVGTFFAILPQAQQYYSQSRTMILFFSNSFNIAYIIISPFIFNLLNQYYVKSVLLGTIATGVAVVGRYMSAQNYQASLIMTIIVAVAHIPLITAPFGILKLFPNSNKPFAASISHFFPILGINFCILYGIAYIVQQKEKYMLQKIHAQISMLHGIIAIVGVLSAVATTILILTLKNKIQYDQNTKIIQEQKNQIVQIQLRQTFLIKKDELQKETNSQVKKQNLFKVISKSFQGHSKAAVLCIAWGSILGINWTYGNLFGIIFLDQNLTEKQIAIIGLAANLGSVMFGSLGAYIKDKYQLQNNTVIYYLNLTGIIAAIIIEFSRYIALLQNLYFLILVIIILKTSFSCYLSLSFMQMQKSGISSLVISGFFFWIAQAVNLIGMVLIDMVQIDFSLFLISVIIGLAILAVNKMYSKGSIQN